MNPEWNTPSDGDFAKYVERLTAQATRALAAPQTHPAGREIDSTRENEDLRTNASTRNGATASRPPQAPPSVPTSGPALRPVIDKTMARNLFRLLVGLLVLANVFFQIPGFTISVVLAMIAWVALRAFTFLHSERGNDLRQRIDHKTKQVRKS